MDNFLTTEEILLSLSQHKEVSIPEDEIVKEKKKFKLNKKLIFWSIVVLAVLHLVFMGIPLVMQENSSNLVGYQYGVVFKKNQDTAGQLIGSVSVIDKINPEDIEVGDDILIFGLYDQGNYYWQLEVTEIDLNDQTLRATFDGNIKNLYTFDDVKGELGEDANLVGLFYYTASTPRGFIIMIFFHALIVYVAYYFLIQKKKKDEEIYDEYKE
ncbi:MAG: hypothetical protein K8Q99_06530 [Acholeplasmataceae bacterium]|nr:hypothetical protein [Acholeplasmataceae bacterium]